MDELLNKLNQAQVRYLLAGGQAMRLAGMLRFSMDWDSFIPARDEENIARLNEVLADALGGGCNFTSGFWACRSSPRPKARRWFARTKTEPPCGACPARICWRRSRPQTARKTRQSSSSCPSCSGWENYSGSGHVLIPVQPLF